QQNRPSCTCTTARASLFRATEEPLRRHRFLNGPAGLLRALGRFLADLLRAFGRLFAYSLCALGRLINHSLATFFHRLCAFDRLIGCPTGRAGERIASRVERIGYFIL